MSEPRRWTIHVCPYCGEQVYSDGWFPCGHDETRFCLEHPEYEQEVDASGTHTSFVGGEQVPARSLVPREVEVAQAALPDDQLREKVAEAIAKATGDPLRPWEDVADAAIEAMCGVSAAPAPPDDQLTADELRQTVNIALKWLTEQANITVSATSDTTIGLDRDEEALQNRLWKWKERAGASAATPAPPEQAKTLDELAPAWERYAARGFTDEDVERVARVMADRSAATSWGGQSDVGRQMWLAEARAVLAAVGPKEGTDG